MNRLRSLASFAALNGTLIASVASAQQISDSAGAKLIKYAAGAKPPATWTVDPKAMVRIGGADGSGPSEFGQILGVARLANGNVVIADGTATELRIFSPTGEYIKTVGRKGAGPGEFQGIQLMYRSADTIIVQDRALRLEIFAGDGTLLRSYGRPVFTGRGVNTWQGLFGDGSGVVQGVDPIVDSMATRSTASLGIRPPDSNEARFFTRIPIFERVRVNGSIAGLFLGAVSRVATMGPRVCAGYTISWEVECFDRTGKLITRTSRAMTPGDVTSADQEEFFKGYRVANKAMTADAFKAVRERTRFAGKRSAFGRFVPSPTGELFVGQFVILESFIPGRRGTAVGNKPTTWSVLGSDGRWIADVLLPAKFALIDAGQDYVAGVELDDDDLETVVVYRLRR